jgi:hypothetical protein
MDLDIHSRDIDAHAGLSSTDYRFGAAREAMCPGQELFFSYGSDYEDALDSSFDLTCDRSPRTCLSASMVDSENWLNMDTKFVTCCLAEDWIRFAVLAPLANRNSSSSPPLADFKQKLAPDVVSHSVGSARRALL